MMFVTASLSLISLIALICWTGENVMKLVSKQGNANPKSSFLAFQIVKHFVLMVLLKQISEKNTFFLLQSETLRLSLYQSDWIDMPPEILQNFIIAGLKVQKRIVIAAPPIVQSLSLEFYGSVR